MSNAPLLPVKPERYRRLGLKETRNASSLRSRRPSATLRRRCSNSLFSILQLTSENLGLLRHRVGLPHLAALFEIVAQLHEIADLLHLDFQRSTEAAPTLEGF